MPRVLDEGNPLDRVFEQPLKRNDFSNPAPESQSSGPSLVDSLTAGVQELNFIGSAINKKNLAPSFPLYFDRSEEELDPNFNPAEYFEEFDTSGWPKSLLLQANSEKEVDELRAYYNRHDQNMKVMSEGGITGTVAVMTGAFLDPTLAIPGAVIMKGRTLASMAKSAAASAAVTGGIVGAQEASLRQTTVDMDLENAYATTVAATIIGGAVGGLVGGKATRAAKAAERAKEEVTNIISDGPKSAGAAARFTPATEDEVLRNVHPTVAKALTGLGIDSLQPVHVRLATSPFKEVNRIGRRLFRFSSETKGSAKGVPPAFSAEELTQFDTTALHKVGREIDDIYAGYLKEAKKVNEARIAAGKDPVPTLKGRELGSEVIRAVMNKGIHENKQIAKIANKMRALNKEKFNKMKQLGILSEDIDDDFAEAYFHINWDSRYVLQNREALEAKIRAQFQARKISGEDIFQVDDVELDTMVRDTADRMGGVYAEPSNINDVVIGLRTSKPAFTKSRGLLLDNLDEFTEYMNPNAMETFYTYHRKADKLIRVQEKLQELGYDNIAGVKKSIVDEFNKVSKGLKGRKLDKLKSELDKSLKLVDDSFDLALGRFSPHTTTDRYLSMGRKVLGTVLMGGVAITSLVDMAMVPFKVGFRNFAGGAFSDLISNLRARNLSVKELKIMNIGLETEMNSLLRTILDPGNQNLFVRTAAEKGVDAITDNFGKISLISYWNNFGKRLAGHSSLYATRKSLMKWAKTGKISKKDRIRLAHMGIGEEDFNSILKEWNKYGNTAEGGTVPNLSAWSNKDAARKLAMATSKDVSETILTPSMSDVPMFAAKSEIGKSIFHLKSFASTASSAILLKSVQRRDLRAVQGLISLAMLGSIVGIIKDKLAGREVDWSLDARVGEGIARSGILGLPGDIVNVFGTGHGSRFADVNRFSFMAGPSAGYIVNLSKAFGSTLDGELTEKEKEKILKLLPYSSLPPIRRLIEEIE